MNISASKMKKKNSQPKTKFTGSYKKKIVAHNHMTNHLIASYRGATVIRFGQ